MRPRERERERERERNIIIVQNIIFIIYYLLTSSHKIKIDDGSYVISL